MQDAMTAGRYCWHMVPACAACGCFLYTVRFEGDEVVCEDRCACRNEGMLLTFKMPKAEVAVAKEPREGAVRRTAGGADFFNPHDPAYSTALMYADEVFRHGKWVKISEREKA